MVTPGNEQDYIRQKIITFTELILSSVLIVFIRMKTTILIIYALILFLLGIYSALKIKTPFDYFLAGKKTGVWQISGSLLATILGGSAILGTIGLSESQSWASAWYILAASLGLLGLLPVVKKVYSKGKFTLPELIGQYYGESARKVTSVIIPIAWLGIVAAQIIAGAQILVSFFSLSYSSGVFLTGIIFIIYTYIGGQVSIMKTDLFQAFFIIGGVVLTAFMIPSAKLPALPDFGSVFPFNGHFLPIDLFILILTFSSTFVGWAGYLFTGLLCKRFKNGISKCINRCPDPDSVWICSLVCWNLCSGIASGRTKQFGFGQPGQYVFA